MLKKTVLIVDDEPDIVEAIRFFLEVDGISCLTAHDGLEALNIAKRERPDLLILDVMLPKMNGFKVARMLKYDHQFKDLAIIMLTARSQPPDAELGQQMGADEYVTKPFDLQALVGLVKKYLHKS